MHLYFPDVFCSHSRSRWHNCIRSGHPNHWGYFQIYYWDLPWNTSITHSSCHPQTSCKTCSEDAVISCQHLLFSMTNHCGPILKRTPQDLADGLTWWFNFDVALIEQQGRAIGSRGLIEPALVVEGMYFIDRPVSNSWQSIFRNMRLNFLTLSMSICNKCFCLENPYQNYSSRKEIIDHDWWYNCCPNNKVV